MFVKILAAAMMTVFGLSAVGDESTPEVIEMSAECVTYYTNVKTNPIYLFYNIKEKFTFLNDIVQ